MHASPRAAMQKPARKRRKCACRAGEWAEGDWARADARTGRRRGRRIGQKREIGRGGAAAVVRVRCGRAAPAAPNASDLRRAPRNAVLVPRALPGAAISAARRRRAVYQPGERTLEARTDSAERFLDGLPIEAHTEQLALRPIRRRVGRMRNRPPRRTTGRREVRRRDRVRSRGRRHLDSESGCLTRRGAAKRTPFARARRKRPAGWVYYDTRHRWHAIFYFPSGPKQVGAKNAPGGRH